jgi:hypothetical protein
MGAFIILFYFEKSIFIGPSVIILDQLALPNGSTSIIHI